MNCLIRQWKLVVYLKYFSQAFLLIFFIAQKHKWMEKRPSYQCSINSINSLTYSMLPSSLHGFRIHSLKQFRVVPAASSHPWLTMRISQVWICLLIRQLQILLCVYRVDTWCHLCSNTSRVYHSLLITKSRRSGSHL